MQAVTLSFSASSRLSTKLSIAYLYKPKLMLRCSVPLSCNKKMTSSVGPYKHIKERLCMPSSLAQAKRNCSLTQRSYTKQPVHEAQSIFEGAISRYVCHYHRFAPYINIWQQTTQVSKRTVLHCQTTFSQLAHHNSS